MERHVRDKLSNFLGLFESYKENESFTLIILKHPTTEPQLLPTHVRYLGMTIRLIFH